MKAFEYKATGVIVEIYSITILSLHWAYACLDIITWKIDIILLCHVHRADVRTKCKNGWEKSNDSLHLFYITYNNSQILC